MIKDQKLYDLIEHYLHVLAVGEAGYTGFLLSNIFKTDKFEKMLGRNISKLYLIYTEEYENGLLESEFLQNEDFIVAMETWKAPIWDFRYAVVLCSSQEDLNLIKMIFPKKDIDILDLTTILDRIYTIQGDNNV